MISHRRPQVRLASALGALLVAAGTATPLHAQETPAAEIAPIVLRLPASTRAMAMGDAHVAVTSPDAIFYNPSLLATARGVHLSAQRMGGASTLGTVSVAIPLAPGGLGIGVQLLDQRAPCVDCPAALPTSEHELGLGGPIAASGLSAAIGWARTLFGANVGAAARYVEQRVGEQRDATVAADIGAGYGRYPFWAGVAVQNLGPSLQLGDRTYDLPGRVTAGAFLSPIPVWELDLSATAALTYHFTGDVTVGGGIEAGYMPLEGYTFAIRAGARGVPGGDAVPSLGAQAGRDRFTLEYAFQPLDGPGDVHRVGLRIRER